MVNPEHIYMSITDQCLNALYTCRSEENLSHIWMMHCVWDSVAQLLLRRRRPVDPDAVVLHAASGNRSCKEKLLHKHSGAEGLIKGRGVAVSVSSITNI